MHEQVILEVCVPRYKTSQELVSHDIHSNTFQYKHTFSVELVPVCKVILSFWLISPTMHFAGMLTGHQGSSPAFIAAIRIWISPALFSPSSPQNEVVCLPLPLARSLGHMSQVVICTRVTTSLHLTDPQTVQGDYIVIPGDE